MADWQVTVGDTCIGAGSCVGITPKHFRLDDNGRSRPVRSPIEPDDAVLDAVASCPMEAITVRDLRTGEVVEP